MKKLLLTSVAVSGLALAMSAPAHADVDLELGGYFKGYGFYSNVDEELTTPATTNNREFDIIRNTEVHFGGESVLDNGLTVGAHIEAGADGANGGDSFDVNESYAYFSGNWGRVNFGAEDGAAYLLQVEAPSADENLDGIRQFVNPVHYAAMQVGPAAAASLATGLNVASSGTAGGLDYDQDISGSRDKLTYLSPVMSGIQFGVSYTPDIADLATENALNFDNVVDTFGAAYDAGIRYEGQLQNIGVIVGAGYSHVTLEQTDASATITAGDPQDDRTAWNMGVDLDIGAFGVGAAYMQDDYGDVFVSTTTKREEEQTFVLGADYTTGPFKVGVSYLDSEGTANITGLIGVDGIEASRWTGGVVYTYGPGMSFRGSVSHVSFENVAGITGPSASTISDPDATSVLLGTQINF